MAGFPEVPLPGNDSLNKVLDDLIKGKTSLSEIQVNSDYVITWNGLFNVIEVILASSLFLVVEVLGGADASLRCMATVSFAMAMQGVHFLLVGLFSPVVSVAIAPSFYYVSFHFMAALFLFWPGCCSVISLRLSITQCAVGVIGGIVAMVLGGTHLAHAIYCLMGTVTNKHNIDFKDVEREFGDLVQ
ncbi:uncharacterized protein LOC144141475 [Haemaphysalis longicornis]